MYQPVVIVRKGEGVIVMPGEELCGTDLRPGTGTFRNGEAIRAAHLGKVNYRSGFVNVLPLGGRYSPRPGDSVIGIVQDVGPSNWMVDINSPYTAFLHGNETQWKVEYGNAGQLLGVGDVVLAKIGLVDETRHVNLTMKEQGLRKMTSGQVVRIPYTRVPLVIGRGGAMIALLKERTGCRIFVGQNGVIWMDGEDEGMSRAAGAINMMMQATDRGAEAVAAFLERGSPGGGRR